MAFSLPGPLGKLLNQPRIRVGVDIGYTSVKAVAIERSSQGLRLLNYAIESFEPGSIGEGEIKNPDAVAQAVNQAVQSCLPDTKEVVICLPGQIVVQDTLSMSLANESEMEEAIEVEVAQRIPFDLSEVCLDYQIIQRDQAAGRMQVLLVAVKREIVYAYVDALSEAGLRPRAMDVDFLALCNSFRANYGTEGLEAVLLLNVGRDATEATFLRNGVYHSYRPIATTGELYLRHFSEVLGVSEAEAAAAIGLRHGEEGQITTDMDVRQLAQTLNELSEEFANGIRTALTFFETSVEYERLNLLVFSGGFARVPGLANFLEAKTGARVEIFNSFRNVAFEASIFGDRSPEIVAPILGVAVGLASREQ